MKVLVICSSENNTKIIASITEAWQKYIAADGRRLKDSKSKKSAIAILKSQEDYDSAQLEKVKPDFVFVQNELHWSKSNVVSGYKIGLDLIIHKLKNHFFNLQFIALDSRKELMKTIAAEYKKWVQAFHHINFSNLKDEISFEKNVYTLLHLELVKSLVLDDSNRINVIEHDVSTIKNNIENSVTGQDLSPLKIKLQNQVEELSILKIIASERIETLIQSISKNLRKETLRKNVSELEKIIDDAKEQLKNTNAEEFSSAKKTNYKVLIVEDEIEWRTFFSNTFSEIYQTVFPSTNEEIKKFSIAQAKDIIKAKKDYNIFVLDLLYKDADDCWLTFSGLDLYQYVKELSPFACIRIITSLPRDIVSKVAGLLLKSDIKVSHVFTKKVGYERLKFGIYDRVLEMNIECKESEKKRTVYKPIPTEGIFKGEGVRDFIFNLMNNNDERYFDCWKRAFSFVEQFESRKLNVASIDWGGGRLPSPKMVAKPSDSYILKVLPNIITHRLLTIKRALENKDSFINADDYEECVLKNISNISTFDKGYLHTKLGFNATPYENVDDEVSGFKIVFKNLFPEEVLFIADIQKKKAKTKKQDEKLNLHSDLSNWFSKVLCDMEIYESWEELNLDFNPYKLTNEIDKTGLIEMKNIDSGLMLSHLEKYLSSLVKSSYNILTQKIIDQTLAHYNIRDEKLIPANLLFLIDSLFRKEN